LLLEERKKNMSYFVEGYERQINNLKPQDIFIDMKLGGIEKIHNLFESFKKTPIINQKNSDMKNKTGNLKPSSVEK
jgi:hypothetical protein